MIFDEILLYLEIQGTTMGIIFAPSDSNGLPLSKTIYRNKKKITFPFSSYFEENWKIFSDDCFIFLRLNLIKPKKLLDMLNEINPDIKLLWKKAIPSSHFLTS